LMRSTKPASSSPSRKPRSRFETWIGCAPRSPNTYPALTTAEAMRTAARLQDTFPGHCRARSASPDPRTCSVPPDVDHVTLQRRKTVACAPLRCARSAVCAWPAPSLEGGRPVLATRGPPLACFRYFDRNRIRSRARRAAPSTGTKFRRGSPGDEPRHGG
jgi:hypothetical protein